MKIPNWPWQYVQPIGWLPLLWRERAKWTPTKLVSPKCLGYKGIKDPIAYVLLFKTIMSSLKMAWDKKDAMLCKSFSSILHDSASKWFSNLKPNSINSFTEFIKLLVTYYVNENPLKREPHHLLSFDEYVEVFMKSFCEEKIEIFENLDFITIQTFGRWVLRNSYLFTKITKMVPRTMIEAYDEA